MKIDTKSLDIAKEKFDRWRSNRKRGERIPKELWDLAVKLTEFHKAYLVCKVLSVDSSGLRKRMGLNIKTDIGDLEPIRIAPISLANPVVATRQSYQSSIVAELTTASGTLIRIFSGINSESVKALSHLMERL